MFERLKLKLLVRISRNISKDLKEKILNSFKREYVLRGFHTKKDLFYSMIEARIYDLYTSSLLTLLYNNPVSLNTLVRGQLDSLATINYFLKNPEKFEDFFTKTFKIEYAKELKKIRPDLVKWYSHSSDYVHPRIEGLKVILTDISEIVPKDPENNPLNSEKKIVTITKEEMEKNFKLVPSLMKEGVPHKKIKPEDFEKIAFQILALYIACLKDLDKLYNQLPDSKVKDIKEFWKRYNLKKENEKKD